MKKLITRRLRLFGITVGFVGAFLALNAIPGAATPPSGFVSELLGRGTYVSNGSLPLTQGQDVVVARNTVQPGGSSGWHSHPGGAIVVVQQGQITFNRSVGNHCESITYTAGQTFVERPGDVGDAVNNGSTVTIVIATFPGVPAGVAGAQRTDEPNPGTCPGL
jgi:quercetin dioxygenase-like cupin family protein